MWNGFIVDRIIADVVRLSYIYIPYTVFTTLGITITIMTTDIKTIPTIAGKPGKAERNWFQRWSTRAIYLGVFIAICQYLNSINVSLSSIA